ncbi:MAG TPA: hypothetical protein VNT53_07055 [Pseudolysinimonas sp.]|nr:hypothetical protein [Pseudolysinimonas sp.]
MSSTTLTVPRRAQLNDTQVNRQLDGVFATLISCLPGLTRFELSPGHDSVQCTLEFTDDDAATFAFMSDEWVDLLEETETFLDWPLDGSDSISDREPAAMVARAL